MSIFGLHNFIYELSALELWHFTLSNTAVFPISSIGISYRDTSLFDIICFYSCIFTCFIASTISSMWRWSTLFYPFIHQVILMSICQYRMPSHALKSLCGYDTCHHQILHCLCPQLFLIQFTMTWCSWAIFHAPVTYDNTSKSTSQQQWY